MEELIPNIMSSIAAYLPDQSLKILEQSTQKLKNATSKVYDDPLFWYERTEILLGKRLEYRKINWMNLYSAILKIINEGISVANSIKYGYTAVSVIMEVGYDPSDDDNLAIIYAVDYGGVKITQLLLKDSRVDPSAQNNEAVIIAVENGYLYITKLLLEDPRVDPSAQDNRAIISAAAKYGYVDIVELLLKYPRVDPSSNNNIAIISAARNGNVDMVRLLLKDPRVDPSAQDNRAIISAAVEYGYVDIVELLLKDPRVDPSSNNNIAIISAARNGNVDMVRLLLKDPRVTADPNVFYEIFYAAIEGISFKTVEFLLAYPGAIISNNDFDQLILLSWGMGQKNILQLLLKDPRGDPLSLEGEDLDIAVDALKSYTESSRSGMAVMHYLYAEKTIGGLYESLHETKTNILGLYYKVLRYIIRKKPLLVDSIKFLNKLCHNVESEAAEVVSLSAKSVIESPFINFSHKSYKKENMPYKFDHIDYFFAFKGFLMLVFDPPYTYTEILEYIKLEGASDIAIGMAAKLIGSQIGIEGLQNDGLIITNDLEHIIEKVLSIDIKQLAN
jgi:ankyrin repeat protein